MIKTLLILGALINLLVCYACCKVASDADDWAEIEWLMFFDEDDE